MLGIFIIKIFKKISTMGIALCFIYVCFYHLKWDIMKNKDTVKQYAPSVDRVQYSRYVALIYGGRHFQNNIK